MFPVRSAGRCFRQRLYARFHYSAGQSPEPAHRNVTISFVRQSAGNNGE